MIAAVRRYPKGRRAQRGPGFRPSAAWVFFALSGALTACGGTGADQTVPEPLEAPAVAVPVERADAAERVEFRTSDGILIAADFKAPEKGAPVFLLLHGLGAGRSEWKSFIARLSRRGWGSLALDARGHGESGGPRYTEFRTAERWAAIDRDLDAAVGFLKGKGIPPARVVPGGASIGANLALRLAAREKDLPFAVLMSPGYDYQGLRIEEPLRSFDRPLVLAASDTDVYALRSVAFSLRLAKDPETRLFRAVSGHGVGMLDGKENSAFTEALFSRIEELTAARISAAASGSRASP